MTYPALKGGAQALIAGYTGLSLPTAGAPAFAAGFTASPTEASAGSSLSSLG